jgi:hypothetical protein
MADAKKDDFFIELNRDLGFRGVHLGKGFVLDGNQDRNWAEMLVLNGDAKKIDKPDHPIEKPWEEALKERAAEVKAALHPTAARGFDAKK